MNIYYTEQEILSLMGIKQTKRLGKDRLSALCKNAGIIIKPVKETIKGKGSVIQYEIIDNQFLLQGEEWVDCIFDDTYEVSNLGRVRNRTNKRLLGFADGKGYIKIALTTGKQAGVHRLVYFSFNPQDFKNESIFTIDHINGIKTDNSLNNLRILSNLENIQYMKKNQEKIQTIVAQLISKYGYETTVIKLNQLL